MRKFFKALSTCTRNESGATAVEYAMIVGLVAAAAFGTIQTFGSDVKDVFSKMSTSLTNKPATTPATTP